MAGQYDTVYEDENYLVVCPKTQAASVYFGKGTKWCTAATVSENYFYYYIVNGNTLIYILSKNIKPGWEWAKKIAYMYQEEHLNNIFYDSRDIEIIDVAVKDYLDEDYYKIMRKIKNYLNSNEKITAKMRIKDISIEEFRKEMSIVNTGEELRNFLIWMSNTHNQEILQYIINNYPIDTVLAVICIHSTMSTETWNMLYHKIFKNGYLLSCSLYNTSLPKRIKARILNNREYIYYKNYIEEVHAKLRQKNKNENQ